MRRHKINDLVIRDAHRALCESDANIRDIAGRFGLAPTTMVNHFQRLGLKIPRGRGQYGVTDRGD